MEDFEIDISEPKKAFERHLALEQNQRIIFSGPFGAGKTYFLEKFFENNDKFSFIRLAPVNYSVAQNEDIFELIKFDILFHLLETQLFPKDADMSRTHILRHLSLLSPEKGLLGIIEKANKTGALSVLKDLEAVLEGTNLPITSEDSLVGLQKLNEFLKEITRDKKGIYECDALTQLLYYIISELKTANREVVLLIDDLDRIDPEHIFRILNVFAAHFDLNDKENKFGFDRVIVVCDLENIRRIFGSRYGLDVDFSGYIDKFYSREVFCFDNSIVLKAAIATILSTIKIHPDNDMHLAEHFQIKSNSSVQRLIIYILSALIGVNAINLRSILKFKDKTFTIEYKQYGNENYTYKFQFIWILELIRAIIGDGISLRNGIQKCNNARIGETILDTKDYNHHLKLGLILPVVWSLEIIRQSGEAEYKYPDGRKLKYTIGEEMTKPRFAVIKQYDTSFNNFADIFPVVLDCVIALQRLGWLK